MEYFCFSLSQRQANYRQLFLASISLYQQEQDKMLSKKITWPIKVMWRKLSRHIIQLLLELIFIFRQKKIISWDKRQKELYFQHLIIPSSHNICHNVWCSDTIFTRSHNFRNLISMTTYPCLPLLSALKNKNWGGKGSCWVTPKVFYEMSLLF